MTALAVLPRPEEKEESHEAKVANRTVLQRSVSTGSPNPEEDSKGDGHDSRGSGVLLVISLELLTQAKVDCSHHIQSRVFGPHAGEDLSH